MVGKKLLGHTFKVTAKAAGGQLRPGLASFFGVNLDSMCYDLT